MAKYLVVGMVESLSPLSVGVVEEELADMVKDFVVLAGEGAKFRVVSAPEDVEFLSTLVERLTGESD